MRSSCPNCLSQMEHAHSDKQVVCSSCGEMFSPFLSASENSAPELDTSDFSESALAFKEIIDFGQSMEKPPSAESPIGKVVSAPVSRAPQIPIETTTPFIWTTGELGAAFRITDWFVPLSRMILLGDDQNPLEKAFHLFKEESMQLGANAMIGIRCSLSPDNKRALIMGTPVRCERNQ